MMGDVLGIVFTLVVVGGIYLAVHQATRTKSNAYMRAEDGAPAELRTATAIRINGTIRMKRPFALHGRPDHVYRLADGMIVVREDKLGRASLHAAIIQASVYASILRNRQHPALKNAKIASHGWVRIGNPERGRVEFVRIRLLTDAELARLVHLYHALGSGYNPSTTRSQRTCERRCPHFRKTCSGVQAPGHARRA